MKLCLQTVCFYAVLMIALFEQKRFFFVCLLFVNRNRLYTHININNGNGSNGV